MPIDPNVNVPTTDPRSGSVSAIENEIPAYRAIHPTAVVALVLGVLSVTSFASPYCLIFAVAAVVAGFLADRKIQRLPEVLTGRGLAQAGLGLGLVFGLTAVTISTVQGVIRVSQAKTFAREYESLLKSASVDQLTWYGQPPSIRVNYTPEAMAKEMRNDRAAVQVMEEKNAGLRLIKKALGTPGGDVHFDRIEAHGEDGLNVYALARFEVHAPGEADPADKERFALAHLKGTKSAKGRLEWWVDEFLFPYQPKTFVSKGSTDTHGHGHAH